MRGQARGSSLRSLRSLRSTRLASWDGGRRLTRIRVLRGGSPAHLLSVGPGRARRLLCVTTGRRLVGSTGGSAAAPRERGLGMLARPAQERFDPRDLRLGPALLIGRRRHSPSRSGGLPPAGRIAGLDQGIGSLEALNPRVAVHIRRILLSHLLGSAVASRWGRGIAVAPRTAGPHAGSPPAVAQDAVAARRARRR